MAHALLIRRKSKRKVIHDNIEVYSREQAYHLIKCDAKIESIHIYAALGETEYHYTRAERDRYGNRITGDRDVNGIVCIPYSNCD